MASFRHLARGQSREWGWGPEPLSFEISIVVKKCKAVAFVNWFKPTCFKSAKKTEIFQFGSMDHFNYVDTVFPSRKFIQVEDSQGFSPPRPTKCQSHPQAESRQLWRGMWGLFPTEGPLEERGSELSYRPSQGSARPGCGTSPGMGQAGVRVGPWV